MTRAGVVTTFARGGVDFAPRALARDARDGSIALEVIDVDDEDGERPCMSEAALDVAIE